MSHVLIRLFRESDIKFAYTSCANEHWNQSLRSVERMFTSEPNGCFVAEVNGKRVGHVFSISYGKLGWIGLLIIDKEYRRIGVGTLLMKKAMSYLLGIGVETIKLEAVPEIAGLYRKLGFVDEFDSLRFIGISGKSNRATSPNVKPLRRDEIEEVAKFDSRYFGANRSKALRLTYEDSPEFCFVSRIESKIIGYIMCYEADTGYRIGPWVCTSSYPRTAKELFSKCIETVEDYAKLFVGVPALNDAAIKLLQNLDFKLYSKSIRMHFGKKLESQNMRGIFAIGGAEKG